MRFLKSFKCYIAVISGDVRSIFTYFVFLWKERYFGKVRELV